jgi:hypothetical protein
MSALLLKRWCLIWFALLRCAEILALHSFRGGDADLIRYARRALAGLAVGACFEYRL